MIAEAVGAGRSELSEIESKQILDAIGIPVATAHLAQSAEEAAELAARVGFPAALKVLSPQAVHKSEVGGVELGLGSPAEVRAAFERIRQSLAAKRPGARFDGVAVQAMAAPGIELIAGMTRDDRFGALVMVGLGGMLVEIFKDTALRIAPITAAGARAMLDELRGVALLARRAWKRARRPRRDRGAHREDLRVRGRARRGARDGPQSGGRVLQGTARARRAHPARPGWPRESAPAADPRHARRIENLRRAFDARTVAVIGDKRMGGYLWLRAMSRFSGKLYSVQIDPNEIPGIEAMGITNCKSLAEVPEPIDYAISAVPRQIAPRILKDCVAAGVKGIGFFTSGFSETGEELGMKLERELRATAAESDIALVGPNCMGLYNPSIGLCNFPDLASGSGGGDVCFISQSGTHSINFCLQAPIRGIRINKAASIGNVLMLEAADYLDVMADDPATRAIGMYVEGVRDGRRFFASLRRAAARHPVVVWKGGMTEAGARATFSHTGSLATAAAVWSALMVQSGAVSVASLDAMLDAMEMLARGRRVGGRGMGLVAMTGGQSVVITDTFAAAGLEVPALSQASYEELKGFFNIIGGSYRNPLDAGGTIGMGHDQGNLDRILDILERDPAIDAIVLEIGTGLRAARWPGPRGRADRPARQARRVQPSLAQALRRDPASGPRRGDRRPRERARAQPRPGGVRQLRARGRRLRRRRRVLAGQRRFVTCASLPRRMRWR